jgi:hypothetical protein
MLVARGNRPRRDQVFCSTNSHLSKVVTHSTPTSPDCAEKAIQVREKQSRQQNLWSYPDDLFLNYHAVECPSCP